MSKKQLTIAPDQAERESALDASRSVLVRAPAGSGKTDLLTRRFLRLLAEVDDPSQIVAITFTKAAAAEMRNRILGELEIAAANNAADNDDSFAMQALAQRALAHSRAMGWNLLDLPALLRVSTIDSFCRDLALQQPLLSRLGGGLDISDQPRDLYRRAARRTLGALESGDPELSAAIEDLLLWRDNGWQDIENQLCDMLASRDRWMHDFVLQREPDWEALRDQLERPFARAVRSHLTQLAAMLDAVPGAIQEAHDLARFACSQGAAVLFQELAELADFPSAPFDQSESLEEALSAYRCLAQLLLTNDGDLRKAINKTIGFPSDRKLEKNRLQRLIEDLRAIPGLEAALHAVRDLPPARYPEDDWQIVRASFRLLRHAAGELKVVFAETGTVDFVEVAQIAQTVLRGADGFPTDAAITLADGIHHLLVDEFQDTSRKQHQLLASLIAAWPQREGRTCFVVGDPMQSIYFFRDADAELFPRVEQLGLEIGSEPALLFDPIQLRANFRAAPELVGELNEVFAEVFARDDGSGVRFTPAHAYRDGAGGLHLAVKTAPRLRLHLDFVPQSPKMGLSADQKQAMSDRRDTVRDKQIDEIAALVHGYRDQLDAARAAGKKFRIAVLGRTRKALAPIAGALREAAIPFRAIDLEDLQKRPEIMDALALARALLNPQDRVAWLGVLRAPWAGLSLADLHALVSADDASIEATPIPRLLTERANILSVEGRVSVERVRRAAEFAEQLRFSQPVMALGTWIEQVWLQLGGAQCVQSSVRVNLDLLWNKLDRLEEGEQDLMGPALQAALTNLCAQPDPLAETDYGVQLMTIHKSKGLEFEVVIVPELQAAGARSRAKLLSWLERGLPPDSAEEDGSPITEFLVAPFQSKGKESGQTKQWVDRVRCEREHQEMRRLLYVAATRAKEELHLFARPEYKTLSDGLFELVTPGECLLQTAWPAIGEEIAARFASWHAEAEPATITSIAAEAMPGAITPTVTTLRRLPADFAASDSIRRAAESESAVTGLGKLYERHEGGIVSRALGSAVHLLLQELARLLASEDQSSALAALRQFEPRITSAIRSSGVDAKQGARITAQAMQVVNHALQDPIGRWILSPHPDSESEVRWTGIVSGSLRTVQVDRVFRAGEAPQTEGSAAWWIIDYKTAHEDGLDPAAALPELRRAFAPQVEAYAKVLRNLRGADAKLYAGLYYPRMALFDWWPL